MKRVEIYFIIYLATIISFFAVEGEVREYKKRQNDILLGVVKDKLGQLIDLQHSDNSVGNTVIFDFTASGNFNPKTFSGDVVFYRDINDENQISAPLRKKDSSGEEKEYYIEQSLDDFGVNKERQHSVRIDMSFMPDINEETLSDWAGSFGERKIAEKVKKLIEDRGKVELSKKLDYKFYPYKVTDIPLFFLSLKSEYSVIEGLSWELPITVAGVRNNDEFDLRITQGLKLAQLKKHYMNSTLSGRAARSGTIRVQGRDNFGQIAEASVELRVREPEWENPPQEDVVYLNDPAYSFDGRIKDIEFNRASMLVSGISYPPEGETIPMPTYRFGPYNKEGSVQIQMLVDGTSVELKHNFTVKKPPPPQIGTPSIIDKNTNIYQVEVRYYGRANEIIKFKPRSGIVKGSYNRISSPRVSGNAMVETWTFQVVNPGSSLASQRVKIWVDDKYNNRDEKTISLRYYYE
jgi:hypothetical protein|tara:strand:+ start:3568 stop:4956 length:1389 start_codon:yes stop_codon:yes gene_type:complete